MGVWAFNIFMCILFCISFFLVLLHRSQHCLSSVYNWSFTHSSFHSKPAWLSSSVQHKRRKKCIFYAITLNRDWSFKASKKMKKHHKKYHEKHQYNLCAIFWDFLSFVSQTDWYIHHYPLICWTLSNESLTCKKRNNSLWLFLMHSSHKAFIWLQKSWNNAYMSLLKGFSTHLLWLHGKFFKMFSIVFWEERKSYGFGIRLNEGQ